MKPFKTDDLFLHRSLQGLNGSPRHGRIVFVASRAIEAGDKYESTIWTLEPAGGDARQLTTTAFNASSPALDPDGKRVAFLSRRNGSTQVQLLSLDGGEAREVSRSDRLLKSILMWSADGQRLLMTAKVPWAEDETDDIARGKDRPWVVKFLPWKLDGSGALVGHRTVLLQLDVASGDERVLLEGDFDVAGAQWSPDGASLAFVRSRDGNQRQLQDVWLADADGGNARQLTHDLVTASGLRWSPDGSRIAFSGSRREGDSISHLWLLEVAGGDAWRPGGDGLQLEGGTIVWDPSGDRLATVAMRHGLHELVVVDAVSDNIERLDTGLRHVSGLCASGDRLAFTSAAMDDPLEVWSVAWQGGDEHCHTGFNRPWWEQRAQPKVDKRTFQVPDGEGGSEEIDAWVLLPAEGEGPFPLLMDFHGGPQSDVLVDYASHVYWYELLSAGWAVVAVNAVGSAGYGMAFARRLQGRWGELDLPQHLAVLDALQKDGTANDRVACAGKSYGGYLSAWAVGHSDRFRAAVVSAPVANLASHSGTSDTGFYVGPYAMGGEITEQRSRYHKLSPVEYCQDVSTPTLLLQGEDDERCPLGQSEELLANLIRCDKANVRMVVYPGGSHKLASTGKPSHRVDYHRRLAAWVRHCS